MATSLLSCNSAAASFLRIFPSTCFDFAQHHGSRISTPRTDRRIWTASSSVPLHDRNAPGKLNPALFLTSPDVSAEALKFHHRRHSRWTIPRDLGIRLLVATSEVVTRPSPRGGQHGASPSGRPRVSVSRTVFRRGRPAVIHRGALGTSRENIYTRGDKRNITWQARDVARHR